MADICHDLASQGDTWDYMWADDGKVYTFGCDGRGYGSPGKDSSHNINFNVLTGDEWNHLKGEPVNPMIEYGKAGKAWPNGGNWKVTGGDCIDGVLYVFVANNWYGNKPAYGGKDKDPYGRQTVNNMSLLKSTDKGRTWTRAVDANYSHPMWTSKRFSTAFFFKYGQNGGSTTLKYGQNGGSTTQDDQDKYVYAISNDGYWDSGSNFYLGRVLRSKIGELNAADWTYFANGTWIADLNGATPVPGFPSGTLQCTMGSPIWLPTLQRYVTVTWDDHQGKPIAWHYPRDVIFTFYQAEHPWGPWTPVGGKACSEFISDLKKPIHRWYGPSLSAKFIKPNPDGSVTVILTFSGQTWEDKPNSLYKNNSCPVTFHTTPLQKPVKTVNDADATYSSGWTQLTNRGVGDFGDDVHQTTTPGASAEYTFEGRGIEVLSEKSSTLGDMEVFVDGRSQGNVSENQNPMPLLYKIPIYRDLALGPGKHTIRIVKSSGDTKPCLLDGFRVY